MENDKVEAQSSAGQQSPALSPPAGTIPDPSAVASEGEVVRVFSNVPAEKLAAVEQLLDGESGPDGPTEKAASQPCQPGGKLNLKLAGARLVVVLVLATAGCGLAHHHSHGPQPCGHKTIPSHATTRHTQAGRRRAEPDGPAVKKAASDHAEGGRWRAGIESDGANPAADDIIRSLGAFQYRPGFEDVWLGGEHYDLRKRQQARLCLEYLVAKKAFEAASARHFEGEIDPYVRKKGHLGARGKFSDIQIKQYFNDRDGRLPKLRKALIRPVAGTGKYYIATGTA